MRLVMIGTGPFGAPTLHALYASKHPVVMLVTGPVRPQHTARPAPPGPLREMAREHCTPVFDPEDINSGPAQSRLAAEGADLLVVCDYGQILAPATLATARCGGINLHASLLPKYRGAAPINWAIYHGETETGVTVIHMTPQIDAGPAIAQARIAIAPEETAPQLEARLAEAGARLICQVVDTLEAGPVEALPQDPALASKAPRLKKTDGLVDWRRPAAAIKNQIRAMAPWPKSYTYWHRAHAEPLRLILGPVAIVETAAAAPPGTVLEATGQALVVAAGQGSLALTTVRPAGKRELSVDEFLRGYHLRPGDRFGPES